MRIGEEIQRREKEQRIAQILVIMGNSKNRLKSWSTVIRYLTGVRETSKTKFTPKRNTKTMLEKQNNQPLYT